MAKVVRIGGRLLAGIGAVFSAILAVGLIEGDAAVMTSDLVYPVVAIGAGALLIVGSAARRGPYRRAWLLFGIGVILSGLGESTWAWYELVVAVEPPFPGLPDVFYVAAYPVFALAILVTPRVAANKYQRAQQAIDGLVITAGVAAVAWITVLEPMYLAAGESTVGELVVGAAYPFGDVMLIATIATVGVRRSFYRRDGSLWLVVGALMLMAVGDIVYLTQSWSGTYVSGSPLDATWLASYALFALAASWLPDADEPRSPRDHRLPLWHVVIPVVVVFGLVVLYLVRRVVSGDGGSVVIATGLSFLGLLVAVRILVTVAEDRQLVDGERRQLVSVVSHELRTPLTAVQGFLDMVLGDWATLDDDGKRDMVEVAHDQVRLVTRIVTDLISTSRDSLHATQLDLEEVDVGQLVRDVVSTVGIGVIPTVLVEPGLIVSADRERLTQILTNLLTNADRYGAGTVTCFARRSDGFAEIEVHDAGPGVTPRYREVIWDRFERGSHRFDASTPGSGLGLAIVRSLVMAHHGQVAYRTSERLGGACFWVRLPLSAAAARLPEMASAGVD